MLMVELNECAANIDVLYISIHLIKMNCVISASKRLLSLSIRAYMLGVKVYAFKSEIESLAVYLLTKIKFNCRCLHRWLECMLHILKARCRCGTHWVYKCVKCRWNMYTLIQVHTRNFDNADEISHTIGKCFTHRWQKERKSIRKCWK